MDYLRSHFAYLAAYNRIANEALVELLAPLPRAELAKPRGSYFGSIQGLLDHVFMCDVNWLRRFRLLCPADEPLGRPRLAPPGADWVRLGFEDFDEYRRERAVLDGIIVDWAALIDLGRLGEVLAYADSRGDPKRYYFGEALDHFFNHQTHHRGQVSQLLDEMRIDNDYSDLLSAAAAPPA